MRLLGFLIERLAAAFARQTLASLRQALTLWLTARRARADGAAEQRLRDAVGARRTEQEMASIVADRRPTDATERRLDEGSF
ncbi:MAG: hypothetical protein M3N38_04670 [Pseudomonadota bacterium]|nr:hypothetical protein [Pseudomonadota bacterium]